MEKYAFGILESFWQRGKPDRFVFRNMTTGVETPLGDTVYILSILADLGQQGWFVVHVGSIASNDLSGKTMSVWLQRKE